MIFIKLFMKLNVFLFRLSGGRLGNKMGNQEVLLLHTVGHRSGKSYVTPLGFIRDGENFLIVGSNWGKEAHPGWHHNLKAQPEANIQVGTETVPVLAREAEGTEFQKLWELVTGKNKQYIHYQQRMTRQAPIIVLEPIK